MRKPPRLSSNGSCTRRCEEHAYRYGNQASRFGAIRGFFAKAAKAAKTAKIFGDMTALGHARRHGNEEFELEVIRKFVAKVAKAAKTAKIFGDMTALGHAHRCAFELWWHKSAFEHRRIGIHSGWPPR